jgi:uncharacterized protein (TIGR02145 family)
MNKNMGIMKKQEIKYLKFRLFIKVICFLFISNYLRAQQSTTGPIRPLGVSTGIFKGGIELKAGTIRIINGVPSYIWHRGCGPTALGMVVGYYDLHGFPDLIAGDAATQTEYVNGAIANDQHYNDYSLPIDYSPNLIKDNSELGGAHTSNCIADFMQTSWSSRYNYWGWSWSSDIAPAFTNYVHLINADYIATTSSIYYSNPDIWDLYKTEIDNNRPVVMLVDTDGNGSTDHFVTGIGYDVSGSLYAIYDTWDHTIHWYPWRVLSVGNTWGIFCFDILNIEASENTISDYDGNVYKIVNIGDQWWMTENLKTTRYNDGEVIPLITDNTEWSSANTPAYCWRSNNESLFKDIYGALYNWYAVNTNKLCPVGWKVPYDGEWKALEQYMGMTQTEADATGLRGTDEGGKLKSTRTDPDGLPCWSSPNEGATNESGFTGLPGGYRVFSGAFYSGIAGIGEGLWWTSSETADDLSSWNRALGHEHSQIYRNGHHKGSGLSVRCVMAQSSPSAPNVGKIVQPACAVSTGSVVLSGLPSGSWTITRSPGGTTYTGSTTSTTVSGLAAGTYTFTVTNALGYTSAASASVDIHAQPVTPAAPVMGTITQPTCTVATGSVILDGLPATGTWTINPGGISGTGTNLTLSELAAGTYTYTVTNEAGCTSAACDAIVINTQPVTPAAPVMGTIIQPTCTVATGSVILDGLPATGTWTINPGGISGTGTNLTLSELAAGTYSYTVMNEAGCTSAACDTVVINAQPETPVTPTITLNGNVLHSDAISGNQWYNQDGLINNEIYQEFTVPSEGNYYVIVTILDCSSDASNSIHVVPITGIEFSKSNRTITVYPNPFSNELIIESEGNNEGLNFEILNSIGRVVCKGSLVGKTIVQTVDYIPGIYMIKLGNNKIGEFRKIIKHK